MTIVAFRYMLVIPVWLLRAFHIVGFWNWINWKLIGLPFHNFQISQLSWPPGLEFYWMTVNTWWKHVTVQLLCRAYQTYQIQLLSWSIYWINCWSWSQVLTQRAYNPIEDFPCTTKLETTHWFQKSFGVFLVLIVKQANALYHYTKPWSLEVWAEEKKWSPNEGFFDRSNFLGTTLAVHILISFKTVTSFSVPHGAD